VKNGNANKVKRREQRETVGLLDGKGEGGLYRDEQRGERGAIPDRVEHLEVGQKQDVL
jgi:hypothetical protein